MADHKAPQEVARISERFIDYLARKADADSQDRNYEIAAAQLDRILSAESADEMWAADDFESVGGRDLVDVEMEIQSFTVHQASDQFKSPLGYWFMIQATRLDNKAPVVFNTGAPLVMGKLRWLEAAELLGTETARVVIRGTDTPNGTVLKLKPVPVRQS